MNSSLSRNKITSAARPKITAQNFVKFIAGSPGRLMVSAWATVSILYFIGPIAYDRPPTLPTWGFITGCILTFMWGSRERKTRASQPPARPVLSAETSNRRINLIVRATGLIGLVGLLCIVVDKIFLSGLDYSQGITALRYDRMAQASLGDEKLSRSLLLYVGSLIVCFTCASYLLYILKAEVLTHSSIWLAQFGLVSPAVLGVLSGGRSPIVLALLLAFGGVMVRTLSNQTPLPKEPIGRRLLLAFVLLALVYNAYVFTERRLAMGVTDYNAFSEHFVNNSRPKIFAGRGVNPGADYLDAVHHLALKSFALIPIKYESIRVVGESCQHRDLMAFGDQVSSQLMIINPGANAFRRKILG